MIGHCQKIAALQPDLVRIYPTLVVKNSRLAGWYQNGTYTPLSLEELRKSMRQK
ncbi:MAG: hypothetical protein KJP23_09655 [Deltaproteobacteria bacterium]|nr:hypothetical protein [Deltaproteobacteria bacterium]